jgi:hypothetical protein
MPIPSARSARIREMPDARPPPFGDQRLTHLARILYTPAGALYTNGFAWAGLGDSDGEIGVSGSAMTLAAASHLAWSGKSSVLMLELTPAPRPPEVPTFCGVAINTTRTKVHMVNLLLKSPRLAGNAYTRPRRHGPLTTTRRSAYGRTFWPLAWFSRQMSGLGQKAKYSERAHVFRSAPNNGHRAH